MKKSSPKAISKKQVDASCQRLKFVHEKKNVKQQTRLQNLTWKHERVKKKKRTERI